MKKIGLFLVFVFIARSASAQFEGVLEMKITGTDADGKTVMSGTVTNSIKGTSTLIESSSNVGGMAIKQVMLMRGNEPNKLYTLDRENKTYTETDLTGMMESANQESGEEYEVKKIGNEKVLGFNCAHVQVKMKKSNATMEMWTSKEVMDWQTYAKTQQNNPAFRDNKFLAALRKENADGMPLKMVTSAGGGKSVFEVVKVEKKAMPASLFEIPKDYKKSEGMFGIPGISKEKMQEMLKQMKPDKP